MASLSNRSKLATLISRQHALCYYCKEPMSKPHLDKASSATLEHKTPKSRGGTGDLENCCAACRYCNGIKGPLTELEFMRFRAHPLKLSQAVRAINAKLQADSLAHQLKGIDWDAFGRGEI